MLLFSNPLCDWGNWGPRLALEDLQHSRRLFGHQLAFKGSIEPHSREWGAPSMCQAFYTYYPPPRPSSFLSSQPGSPAVPATCQAHTCCLRTIPPRCLGWASSSYPHGCLPFLLLAFSQIPLSVWSLLTDLLKIPTPEHQSLPFLSIVHIIIWHNIYVLYGLSSPR